VVVGAITILATGLNGLGNRWKMLDDLNKMGSTEPIFEAESRYAEEFFRAWSTPTIHHR
jgi:hypothetical protein